MKFITRISLLLFSFTLTSCVETDSTKKVNDDSTANPKTQQIQSQPDSSSQHSLTDTLKPDELSNTKNLIGYWLIPHNAGINLQFNENGTFIFNDYNIKLDRSEELKGKYQLEKGRLTLIYIDRPRQVFKFYKDGDLFYIKKGNYYLVKGEKF
jgi:hypothetical protein